MLRVEPVLFTRGDPFYLDKAKQFPNTSFVIGADALKRMFDPKWGYDVKGLANKLWEMRTKFYVLGRVRDGVWIDPKEVCESLGGIWRKVFQPVAGRWDISSTEVRNNET